MAFLKNKELEAENARLKQELAEIIEDRTRESSLKDMIKIAKLNKEIRRLETELAETIEKLNERAVELEKADSFKKQKTADAGKIKRLEAKLKEKDEYIEQLHTQVEELMVEKHQLYYIKDNMNKSKVGRKSKATEENIAEIARLHNEGFSYSQIAKYITENSKENISKSTVAKIAKAHFSSIN
ncbi:MAG: helix-turn-helix domain-containing protein [Oscillospiraceae bacterium]|nr:helix-turn-helix domain-containing protein [Oscillospiraceae bacterium]